MRRHEPSDEERAIVRPLLPNKPRGAPWRDIPERHGPRTTLYDRFVRWRAAGVWDRIPEAVSEACDGDVVMIDSSCVRVHQHGAAVKRGARRRWRPGLTPGQAGDAPVAAVRDGRYVPRAP